MDYETINPFDSGDCDAVRRRLISVLGSPTADPADAMFRLRAEFFVGTITPALMWLRDVKGIELTIELIRRCTDFGWISRFAIDNIAVVHDPKTGRDTELDVSDASLEDVIWPLRAYLGELPGFSPSAPLGEQSDLPSQQHGYVTFRLTRNLDRFAAVSRA